MTACRCHRDHTGARAADTTRLHVIGSEAAQRPSRRISVVPDRAIGSAADGGRRAGAPLGQRIERGEPANHVGVLPDGQAGCIDVREVAADREVREGETIADEDVTAL